MSPDATRAMLLLLLACFVSHAHTQLSTWTPAPSPTDGPICKTFIRIEDKSLGPSLLRVTSPIVVTDAFPVSSIIVRNIRLRHSRIGSLKVDLTAAAPQGSTVKRITLKPLRAGGAGQDMNDTTFSEAKTAKRFPYSEAAAPFSGTYLPEIPLTTLTAGNSTSAGEGGSAGTWALVITDFGRREKNETRQIQLDRWTLILCSNATQTDTAAPLVIPPATSVLTPRGSAGTASSTTQRTIPSSGVPTQTMLDTTGLSGTMSNTSSVVGALEPAGSNSANSSTTADLSSGAAGLPGTNMLTQTSGISNSTTMPVLDTTAGLMGSQQTGVANSSATISGSSTAGLPSTAPTQIGLTNTSSVVSLQTSGTSLDSTTGLPTGPSAQTSLTNPSGAANSSLGYRATVPNDPANSGTATTATQQLPSSVGEGVKQPTGQTPRIKTLQGPADSTMDTSQNENIFFQLRGIDPSQFSFWELGSGSNLARMTGLNVSDLGTGSNLLRLGSGLGRAGGILDQMLGDYGLDRDSITSLLRDANPLISAFSDDNNNGVNKTQQVETVVNLLTLGINALAGQLGQNLADTALDAARRKEKYQLNTDNLNSLGKVATFLPRAYRRTAETYSQLLNDTGSVLNRVLNNNAGLLTQLSSSLQILGSVLLNNLEANLNQYTPQLGGGSEQLRGALGEFKNFYQEYQNANQEVLNVAKSLVPETATNFNNLQDAFQGVLEQVGSIIGNATGLLRSSQTSVLQRYAETVGLLTQGLKKYVSSRPASNLLQGQSGKALQYLGGMLQSLRDRSEEVPGLKSVWKDFQTGSGRLGGRSNLISWPNFTLLNMVKNIDSYLDSWYRVAGGRGRDDGWFG